MKILYPRYNKTNHSTTVTTLSQPNHKIIQWAYQYLISRGYALKSNLPENVQNTPWSYVARFITSDGYVYLKHTPNLLALEPIITKILKEQFHAPVPEIIAHNAELNCFLMQDAGRPLREILKKQFDATLLCKAIEQFTSLQSSVADHLNIFLDIGVPDWRLDKLPDLFKVLLSQKDLLIIDGLAESEIHELMILVPKIANLCNELSEYSIKQTFVQCDFHDNNILVNEDSQNITFVDLGEIVISHPFFSLIGFLRQMKTYHALKDRDEAYLLLRKTCLKNYMNFESEENLIDAFELAYKLWFVYESLAQYRLRVACDKEKFLSFQRQGKLSGRLREFIIGSSGLKSFL